MVGVLAGLVAVAFRWALHHADDARGALLAFLHEHHPAWGWAVLPIVGFGLGSLVGWGVRTYEPSASGSGIPHVKGVLVRVRELRWTWLLPIKFVGGVLCIGAGASLGREGPTVQMGAAVGQMVASILRVPRRTVAQLVSSGAGAGVAAAFNAPLAGFLFVLEELHREMSQLTYGGALVAAVSATAVSYALSGQLPSFEVRNFAVLELSHLPLAAILGVAGGLLGVAFNRSLLAAQARAHRWPKARAWLLTGLLTSVAGLVAWWVPEAVGGGHGTAQGLLRGAMLLPLGALVGLLLAKFALTVLSYASGAPGGIFAPMLLMGAILGLIFGRLAAMVVPSLEANHAAFAVLGMAVAFTASVRAPLTGIVLIMEMTQNYGQLFALCIACMGAYFTAELLRDRPIYEALLEEDLARSGVVAHPDELTPVVMSVQRGSAVEGKKVRDAGFPQGSLVVSVERAGKELVPSAGLVLAPGDHITVFVPGDRTQDALRVVDLCRAR